MHRNIRTAAVAFVLLIGGSGVCLAADTAASSTTGVGGDHTAEGIGNTQFYTQSQSQSGFEADRNGKPRQR